MAFPNARDQLAELGESTGGPGPPAQWRCQANTLLHALIYKPARPAAASNYGVNWAWALAGTGASRDRNRNRWPGPAPNGGFSSAPETLAGAAAAHLTRF